MIYRYTTIRSAATSKLLDRGSKFFGMVIPVNDRGKFDEALAEVRTEHPKARHHCFALRILAGRSVIELAHNDGEPSGSAGKPILNAIKSAQLLNAGIIVARYFGGTKLGIPGLINAYRSCAQLTIEQSTLVEIEIARAWEAQFDYKLQPAFVEALKRHHFHLLSEEYNTNCRMAFELPAENETQRMLAFLKFLSKKDYQTIAEYANALSLTLKPINEST